MRQLGAAGRDVRILAVSVDPAGDTTASVRRFVTERNLLPQFHYLTGTADELRPIWRKYHVEVNPKRLDEVDHSAYTMLVDRYGRGIVVYGPKVKTSMLLHDLRLMRASH